MENEQLAEKIEKIHMESLDKGYRRINDDLRHNQGIHVNDKRVLRICRAKDIRSTIKHSSHGCTRRAKNPQYLAENLLNRQFHASKPNERWLTDVKLSSNGMMAPRSINSISVLFRISMTGASCPL